jgi:hypothetical protein
MDRRLSLLALLAAPLLRVCADVPRKVVLENARVRVTLWTYEPGVTRQPFTREHDQVIVFLSDCRYRRDLPAGGSQEQTRQAGDVIWHNRGEFGNPLTNLGSAAYRTLMIELL